MAILDGALFSLIDLVTTKQTTIFLLSCTFTLLVLSRYSSKKNLRQAIETVRVVRTVLPLDVQYPSVKGFNPRTYRWAAVSSADDAPVQSLSLLIVTSSAMNPSWYILRYLHVSGPFLLFEVAILPQTKGLYAILVGHHEGKTFNNAYPYAGARVSDAKSPSLYHQAYESCSGLARGLYDSIVSASSDSINILKSVITCALMEDKIIFHTHNTGCADALECILRALKSAIHYATSFSPTDVQRRQISKKMLAAEREMANVNAQKRSEEAAENTKKLLKEYNERLRDPNITESERRRINRKLDSIEAQQRASLGKMLFGYSLPKMKPSKKSRTQIVYQ
ncbi:Hypothetical protein GLP15_3156 [Giardia lamblia P15]|uniref:Uncharacterized protein n=1 Tax=Giardia intestinalis (strain P15) TaxID=658858 RepID=E1F7K3_GIAIA|nr:Hypothetical protein GLP15_3156 [Giardia lamblia P15]